MMNLTANCRTKDGKLIPIKFIEKGIGWDGPWFVFERSFDFDAHVIEIIIFIDGIEAKRESTDFYFYASDTLQITYEASCEVINKLKSNRIS